MKGWKRELVPVQHQFPNCNIRYKTKCKDMKSCDKDVIERVITPPIKTDYTLLTEKDRIKAPIGFEVIVDKDIRDSVKNGVKHKK